MATTVKINAKIRWDIWRDKESGWWVGACDAVNVTASGRTWRDLTEDMNGMLQDCFLDLFRSGELVAFLKAKGWQLGMPPEGMPSRRARVDFDVPWDWERVSQYRGIPVHA